MTASARLSCAGRAAGPDHEFFFIIKRETDMSVSLKGSYYRTFSRYHHTTLTRPLSSNIFHFLLML